MHLLPVGRVELERRGEEVVDYAEAGVVEEGRGEFLGLRGFL